MRAAFGLELLQYHVVGASMYSSEKVLKISLYPVNETVPARGMPKSQSTIPERNHRQSMSTTHPLSPVELPPLDIDAILTDRHAQILHREHRPPLRPTLAAASIPRSLHAEHIASFTLLLALLPALAGSSASRTSLPGHLKAGRRAQRAHRVVGAGV